MNDRITPQMVTKLNDNEIFVFGSNKSGIQGAGAARIAHQLFGAEWGAGIGPTGKCYAIPTKDYGIRRTLTPNEIKPYVDDFIEYVKAHPELTFLVTPIGTGLARIEPEKIALLFKDLIEVENVYLPMNFIEIIEREWK